MTAAAAHTVLTCAHINTSIETPKKIPVKNAVIINDKKTADILSYYIFDQIQ